MGIDFSKYPKASSLIKDCDMESKADRIVWLQFTKSDAAVSIVEMNQMCKAGLSDNIPLRKRSQNSANYYRGFINPNIHVFAQEQAMSELGLSREDVENLFVHKGLFA